MLIHTFPLGALQTNCYIVSNEQTKEAIIIDVGASPEKLMAQVEGYEVKAILLTHAHFDHIAGLNEVRKKTGAPVYLHSSEKEWLADPELNLAHLWSMVGPFTPSEDAEFLMEDGQKLKLAGFDIEVLHTPGHSPGGVSFKIDDHVFSGDALFAQGIGRTDLPGGNHAQLIQSILDKIFVLSDATTCYPGHGPKTMIGDEKAQNPYVR